MISVTSAVAQVVENSEFAREGLREGLLNMSAYAKIIRPQIENLTKTTPISDSSIIMALSRYGKELRQSGSGSKDTGVNTMEVTTIIYRKTPEIQERLAMLLLLDSIKHTSFFTVTITADTVILVTHSIATGTIRGHFGATRPNSQETSVVTR